MRIFVYGSLRTGQSNHHELRGARCLGPARTLPAWAIVAVGPWLGLSPGTEVVEGEVFEVDDADIARLDAFEGSQYVRRTIELEVGTADAWVVSESRSKVSTTVR